jgi:hypothetical protein
MFSFSLTAAARISLTLALGITLSSTIPAQSNWRWISHSDAKFEAFGPSAAEGQYSAWVGGYCTDEVIQKNVDWTSPGIGWSCTNGTVAIGTISNAAYEDLWFDQRIHAYIHASDSVTTFNPPPTEHPMSNNWGVGSEYHCNGPDGYNSGPIFIGGTANPCPDYPVW